MDKYNHPPFLIKRFYNTPPTPYILDESYQPSIDEMLFISELVLAYAKRERELELQLTIEKLLTILADEQINPHTYDITDLGTIHAAIGCIITYERPYYHLYRVQHGKHNLLLQTQDEHIISEACLQELAKDNPRLTQYLSPITNTYRPLHLANILDK